LDQAEQSFSGCDVGEALFAILGGQFQLVTVCNQLTAFLGQDVIALF
jgi:hypothetical protein